MLERRTRVGDSRENESRQVEEMRFKPSNSLPDIPEHPDWVYRWIAVTVNQQDFASNVNQQISEGWIAVTQDELPTINTFGRDREGKGNILAGNGTLMLFKMPRLLKEARDRHYKDNLEAQLASVQSNITALQGAAENKKSQISYDVSAGTPLATPNTGRSVSFGDGK